MKTSLDTIIGFVLVLLLGLMVVDVSWQVFSRYILNSPSPYTEELARFLMIWIGVLGAAYAAGQRAHLAITLFPEKLGPKSRKSLDRGIAVLIALFALTAFVIGGGRLVYVTYILGQNSASLKIPLFVVYSIIPLSGLLIIVFKIRDLINTQSHEH